MPTDFGAPPSPIFLTGPTAGGKSELALRLAEILGGEIVSVDSMQVYRGMDIGTAKPSPGERERVPHHLIDILDLDENFDAARFVQEAREAENDILARGRIPIFCGGTGLYFKAYLEGLGQNPPSNPALRSELGNQPLEVLLERLRSCDPEAYAKVDRNNPRRVIRALAIVLQTGQPLSTTRVSWTKFAPHSNPGRGLHKTSSLFFFGLHRSPEELRRRIERRVDAMFRQGLVEETQELMRHGLAQNMTASQALGYRQVKEYLEGQRSLQETIELIKTRTRRYAKRQMTWFRTQLSLTWIEGTQEEGLEEQATSLAQLYIQRQKKGLP